MKEMCSDALVVQGRDLTTGAAAAAPQTASVEMKVVLDPMLEVELLCVQKGFYPPLGRP